MANPASVVVLGTAGPARDQLVAALGEAGALVALASSPVECTVEQVTSLSPRNVVVLAEPDIEDALERFEPLFARPDIEFLFEEASVLAARQGWDAARWSRHLASKLHLRDNEMPEGLGSDEGFVAPRPMDARRQNPARDESLQAQGQQAASAAVNAPAAEAAGVFDHGVYDAPAPAMSAPAASAFDAPLQTSVEPALAVFDTPDFGANQVTKTPASHVAAAPLAFDDVSFDLHTLDTGPVQIPADIPDLLPDLPDVQHGRVVVGQVRDAGESAIMQGMGALDGLNDVGPRVVTPSRLEDLSPEQILAGIDMLADVPDSHLPAPNPHETAAPVLEMDAFAAQWVAEAPAPSTTVPMRSAAAEIESDVPAAMPDFSSLSLDDITPDAAPSRVVTAPRLQPDRPMGLSLADDGTAGLGAMLETPPGTPAASHLAQSARGAVWVVAGVGGPDPLRTLLGSMNAVPRPILVQQHLDAGNYDRLARQMERAAQLPVKLAAAGMAIEPGTIYILPNGLDVNEAGELAFVDAASSSGFPDLSRKLDLASSTLIVLSGATPECLDAVVRIKAAGGTAFAQSAQGCFDHAVPALAIQRGADADEPGALATRLGSRLNG